MYDVQKTAQRRARPVIAMVALTALLFVMATWGVLDGLRSRDPFSRSTSPFTSLLLMLGAGVVTVALWMAWFKVLHERVVDARRGRFTRGAWFWAWLIPGTNVVVPKMMVNDVWRAGDVPGTEPSSPPWPVQAWWALWVVAELSPPLGKVFDFLDLDRLPPGFVLTVYAAFVVVEAALAVATVRVLTRRIGEVVPAMPPQPAPDLVHGP